MTEVTAGRRRRLEDARPLAEVVRQAGGVDVAACLECGRCTGGCSTGELFDYTPRQIVQLIKLGDEDKLLRMEALSACVGCQLCRERCPAGIDVAALIDVLRARAAERGIPLSRDNVRLFDDLLLKSIYRRGRVTEFPLMVEYNLRMGKYTNDAQLGVRLLRRRMLRLLPARVWHQKAVKRLFSREPRP